MNYQGYATNKQHEGDIPANQSAATYYVSHNTEEAKLKKEVNTFTMVELSEPRRQRLKKRRAYEFPLL